MKLEEGLRLSLEVRPIAEEEHTRLEAEEEARLVEQASLKSEEEQYTRLEARLKDEEEEEDLLLKAKEEAQLTEEARMKEEEAEKAELRDDEEVRLSE